MSGILLFVSCGNVKNEGKNKIEELIQQMTLEEKVGQMTNIGLTAVCKGPFWSNADSLEIDIEKLNKLILKYHIGSIQNKGKYPPTKEEWYNIISQIQNLIEELEKVNVLTE